MKIPGALPCASWVTRIWVERKVNMNEAYGASRLKRQLLFVMWNVKYTLRRIFSQNFDDIFFEGIIPISCPQKNPRQGAAESNSF